MSWIDICVYIVCGIVLALCAFYPDIKRVITRRKLLVIYYMPKRYHADLEIHTKSDAELSAVLLSITELLVKKPDLLNAINVYLADRDNDIIIQKNDIRKFEEILNKQKQ